jgi:hypothetical protein
MKRLSAFGITEDGVVYDLRGENMERRLGHIACILHDCNSTIAAESALDVCDWWNALMKSDGPVGDYIPHKKYEGGGRAVPKIEISNYDSEGLQEVLEEILPAA